MIIPEWEDLGLGVLISMGMPTFRPKALDGLGDGSEDPDLFSPSGFVGRAATLAKIRSWVDCCVRLGAKYVVVVIKHYDGFCLWPATHSVHNISASAYYEGSGSVNIAAEVFRAARAAGLRIFAYLTIYDAYYRTHGGAITEAAYTAYTNAMITEIADEDVFGKIDGLWLDSWVDFASPLIATVRAHMTSLHPEWLLASSGLNPEFSVGVANYQYIDIGWREQTTFGAWPAGQLKPSENVTTYLPSTNYFWHDDEDYSAYEDGVTIIHSLLRDFRASRINGYNTLVNLSPDDTGSVPSFFTAAASLRVNALRKTVDLNLGDNYTLVGAEAAGVAVFNHVSDFSGTTYVQSATASSTNIISPDGTSRANGTGAAFVVPQVTLTSADYSFEQEFGFFSAPATSWGTGAHLRTDNDDAADNRYRVAFAKDGSNATLSLVNKTPAVIKSVTIPFTPSLTSHYRIAVSISGQTERSFVWETIGGEEFLLATLEGTVSGLTAAGKPVIEYQSNPNSDSTGLYYTNWKLVTEVTTATDAPDNVQAMSQSVGNMISWDAVAGADAYLVYRLSSGDDDGYMLIATTPLASLLDDDVDATTTYNYKIKARDTALNLSEFSEVAEVSGLRNQITVGELVTRLRIRARNAGVSDLDDTVYSLEMKHLAIYDALSDFIDQTQYTRQTDTIEIAEDDSTADFSGISGWHPRRWISMQLFDSDGLIKVPKFEVFGIGDTEFYRRRGAINDATTVTPPSGTPCSVGFTTPFIGTLDKDADADYSLRVIWSPPLTDWTAGDESSDTEDTVVNVPKDVAVQVIDTLAISILLEGQASALAQYDRCKAGYAALLLRCKGAGAHGIRSESLETADEIRDQRRMSRAGTWWWP